MSQEKHYRFRFVAGDVAHLPDEPSADEVLGDDLEGLGLDRIDGLVISGDFVCLAATLSFVAARSLKDIVTRRRLSSARAYLPSCVRTIGIGGGLTSHFNANRSAVIAAFNPSMVRATSISFSFCRVTDRVCHVAQFNLRGYLVYVRLITELASCNSDLLIKKARNNT